jgi:hypothetical protein
MGAEVGELLPNGALCCDFCGTLQCTQTACLEIRGNEVQQGALLLGAPGEPRLAPLDLSSFEVRQRYGWACPSCWASALEKVPKS